MNKSIEKYKSPYIVFSAPSGAGKTTIIKSLLNKHDDIIISVSATTRSKRAGEENGRDYYFLTVDEFEESKKNGRFLEYEEVHGNYYGTLKEKVDKIVNSGKPVVFDLDVKGATSIKKAYPNALLIFIKPPSKAILEDRLRNRKSEDTESIELRLNRLEYEFEQAANFDHHVINDNLENTIKEVESLILK